MNNGMTIPIKTLPDLIDYYERRAQKIADHYQQRAVWGHSSWDNHELELIKEFLNLLYGLDRDEEIEQLKRKTELAWQRMYKYIRPAFYEVVLHCRNAEEEKDDVFVFPSPYKEGCEEDDESGTD